MNVSDVPSDDAMWAINRPWCLGPSLKATYKKKEKKDFFFFLNPRQVYLLMIIIMIIIPMSWACCCCFYTNHAHRVITERGFEYFLVSFFV